MSAFGGKADIRYCTVNVRFRGLERTLRGRHQIDSEVERGNHA
jgi:hypothetical protein